jgi:hypothetical protein
METIEAKELTVKQIREILKTLEEGKTHDADLLFPDESSPLLAVSLSFGVSIEDLEKETPSRLKVLFEEMRKANPIFADTMDRFAKVGREVLAAKDSIELSAD